MVLSLLTCSSLNWSFDFNSPAKFSCAKNASNTGKVTGWRFGGAFTVAVAGGAGVAGSALFVFVLAAGFAFLLVSVDSLRQPTPARRTTITASALVNFTIAFMLP